jgi:LuxR family transcriptional regulator, quorum-sensing system regulator SinR
MTVDSQKMLSLEGDSEGQKLDEFILSVRNRYGLANISYVSSSLPGHSLTNPFYVTTFSEAWKERYRSEGYVAIDPVVNVGARSVLPLDWATLPRADKKVWRMFREAEAAGVGRQGLVIPARGPVDGVWGLLAVSSYDDDAAWRVWCDEFLRDFVLIAAWLHQRAYDLHAEEPLIDLNAITKRELEALVWSAEGKTIAEIAALLGKSELTVRSHLDSARFKLQAHNRTHAVAKAIRAGLVQ